MTADIFDFFTTWISYLFIKAPHSWGFLFVGWWLLKN